MDFSPGGGNDCEKAEGEEGEEGEDFSLGKGKCHSFQGAQTARASGKEF
jgi:hypothetical protein